MDGNIEKECGALGGLFQQIINEMKTGSPVWEDFIGKAGKLHTALRATILATNAFLDAFQRVADMATNTKGATRDIGSALTRLCMRHRSIENKLKHFTSAMLDAMVVPMQDRMEEWKRNVIQLDKDHAKEYKKARQEIKRASSDTVRLQKKVKKGKGDLQQRLDHSMQDVNDKFHALEETEKKAVRTALIEERSRFCHFITCLKPVVDLEVAMLGEITHLQEITQHLCLQAGDPFTLPASSEQVITDLKGKDHPSWSFQTPPGSPTSSLGSRKSSMCSMSSINSSSSGSTHSPSHHFRHPSQPPPPPGSVAVLRLSSVSSQDSGFTSQDTLFLKPPSPLKYKGSQQSGGSSSSSSEGTSEAVTPTSPACHLMQHSNSASTWTNWPELPSSDQAKTPTAQLPPSASERPHTISTAYEKSHSRPPLTAMTFEPPEQSVLLEKVTSEGSASVYAVPCIVPPDAKKKEALYAKMADIRPPPPGPKMRARPVVPPVVPDFNVSQCDQIYVNMNELATMAAQKQMDKKKAKESDAKRPPRDTSKARPQRSSSVPATQTPNSMELANAIKELEASTAALQKNYDTEDGGSNKQRHSLQSSFVGSTNEDPELYDFLLDAKLAQESQDVVNFDLLRDVGLGTSSSLTLPHKWVNRSMRHRPASSLGCVPDSPSVATIRRGSFHSTKPSTPLRRNSSLSGALPVMTPTIPTCPALESDEETDGDITPLSEAPPSETEVSVAPAQTVIYDVPITEMKLEAPTQRRQRSLSETSNSSKVEAIVQNFELQMPPPPPNKLTPDLSSDDLPLPPPPDELLENARNGIESLPPKSRGSVSESHATIMHTLNEKFSSPPSVAVGGMASPRSFEMEDITPTGEGPLGTGDSFIQQITRGVRLRKTISNDRSGPRFS